VRALADQFTDASNAYNQHRASSDTQTEKIYFANANGDVIAFDEGDTRIEMLDMSSLTQLSKIVSGDETKATQLVDVQTGQTYAIPELEQRQNLKQAMEDAEAVYEQAADDFRVELVLNPNVNEVTYSQFRDLMPGLPFYQNNDLRVNFWPDGDGASLNECRVKYGNNVAGERADVAAAVADCMKENDVSSFWALVGSIALSLFLGIGSAIGMNESYTLQDWSRLPKPKKLPKPDPN